MMSISKLVIMTYSSIISLKHVFKIVGKKSFFYIFIQILHILKYFSCNLVFFFYSI